MTMPRRYLPTMFMQINNNNNNNNNNQRRKSCEQDDASTSSTMTVERRSSIKQVESTTAADDAASGSRRSVSFCMAKNESFSNNVMCEEDLRELWYENSEYKDFRSFTMCPYVAKEINKAEARSMAPLSYERVMTHTYRTCCKATSEQGNVLTADEFKHLVRWAEVATSQLGLETRSIRSVRHDRSFRRSLMLDMVLEAQNNYQDDFVSMDDYVADSCATISRPMRLFSRTLAEAQAVAARNDLS
jgi:hypothetical protein